MSDRGPRCGSGGQQRDCQVLGFVQPRLLLLLSRRPAHGYELMERMRSVPVEARLSEPGLLYRTLRQFESDGLVTSSWCTDLPAPARRVYRLTDSGREYLDLWASSIRAAHDRRGRFLAEYRSLAADRQPSTPPDRRRTR